MARPSRYGNPTPIAEYRKWYPDASEQALHAMAVSDFDGLVTGRLEPETDAQRDYPSIEEIKADLAGVDLACFCRPPLPCHVDVLLRVANT